MDITKARVELERHHASQSAAITALHELEEHSGDYLATARVRKEDQARDALREIGCPTCLAIADQP